MNCDWLEIFDERLGRYPEVRLLKGISFHGTLEINFCAGIPQNYNLKIHRKATEQKEEE
jgi:hypothetical protein